ncbi:MAG TPA: PVC-type heme-binding CxxCH protein, partial [Prosthecobacter sp.]
MKSALFLLLLAPLAALSQKPAEGPVRVLYVDATGAEALNPGLLHEAMRDLGRDAIWFDHARTAGASDSYDVVIRAGEADSVAALQAKVMQALPPQRRASYEAFLAQREPEKREAHPMVANYEKRPQPLTFQHPFGVKGSMERTQVPADLELKLFAAEPDIRKPIAFAWDERGRLWVCETSDYPHGLVEDGRGHDSIKICEDTDGDGRADKFTVFADRLNIPTALVFARGGVIVSQPPRFMFLKDTDGDDKADVREDIITGYGIRDTHAQASNLHYGLDNWIYGCVGYSGFEGEVGGQPLKFTMGTYRFRPDGKALEFLHQFTNNAWGHSANAAGDQFGGTANGAPIFYGGIPNGVFPPGMRGMTASKINEVDTVHTITPNFRQVDVFGGYTAACGSAFIESASLPARFQGMAMVCEPTMKVITLMDVKPQGAGYVAHDAYNLVASTDEWMSPVFAEVGPDGAVWFADFQNFIIQHNPTPSVERGGFKGETGVGGAHKNDLRDHERGRIYRIVSKTGTHLNKPPALDADTQVSRLTAQRLAVESGKLPENLPAVLKQGGAPAAHALWTLQGTRKLDEATHKAALLSADAVLRRNAVRALGNDAQAAGLLFGSGTLTDADAHTRLAAWVKLAQLPTTEEIRTLVSRISADPAVAKDEWLREAARLLSRKHGVNAFKEGPNLLANAGFEKVGKDGLPEGWKRRDYGKSAGNAGAEWKVLEGSGDSHTGTRGLRCITRQLLLFEAFCRCQFAQLHIVKVTVPLAHMQHIDAGQGPVLVGEDH